MNVMMLLEMTTSGFGERVAVQNGADKLTYSDLFAAAGRTAAKVKSLGAERLALFDINSLAVPVALFGSGWAGVPFVPLNYRLASNEVEALLERITPCVLIVDPEKEKDFQSIDGVTTISRDAYLSEVTGDAEVPEPSWSMDPEDIAVLLFTSGTTGAPKAAVLRHKHLVSYIFGSVEFGGAAEDEAALYSVPPYHIAGMAAILSSAYLGRRVVQFPNFTAPGWLELARNEKITHAFVVPTMLARIVDELGDADSADLPSLKAVSYGGGKMPLPIIEKAMSLFPAETGFTNAYGLTETSSTISVLGPDDHRVAIASDDPAVRRRLVSVGRPLPSVEVQIRDDEGNVVGPNESGEICVSGEQVSGEYLGRGSSVGSDGWFPTRDGGSMDEEGYLFVEGRIDDVIVRGGENLSPGEIEDVLHELESVSDVAVVGVPDVQWGEAVAAVVVTQPGKTVTADELCDWVKQHLRSNRVPSRVEFWDELPYNETGKLLRRKVKERLVADAS